MTTSNKRTILSYRARMDSHGWLERRLMPSGYITDILAEQSFWGDHHKLPEPGDRFIVTSSRDGSGRSTHSAEGDWIVDRVVYYPRPSDDEPAIAICYCEYSPIEKDWKPMNVGRPVPELLAEMDAVMAE